jgi:PX domain
MAQNELVYLPNDTWSPRYDSTFYTVKLNGFELVHDTLPSDGVDRIRVPGKTNLPAYYYRVDVYRRHERTTLLRRYSQFQWLYHELMAHSDDTSSSAVVDPTATLHFPSAVVCRFQWWQDDAFAMTRMQDLAVFLSSALVRPNCSRLSAVRIFLSLQ